MTEAYEVPSLEEELDRTKKIFIDVESKIFHDLFDNESDLEVVQIARLKKIKSDCTKYIKYLERFKSISQFKYGQDDLYDPFYK
jgi:hypothetical protein